MSNTNGWIKCIDRLPTKEDASRNGYVHVYKPCGDHSLDDIITWYQLRRDCEWLWSPWPKPPEPELNPVCPECGSPGITYDNSGNGVKMYARLFCPDTECAFQIFANTKTRAIELCNALPRKK